jgi:hypothetical protein
MYFGTKERTGETSSIIGWKNSRNETVVKRTWVEAALSCEGGCFNLAASHLAPQLEDEAAIPRQPRGRYFGLELALGAIVPGRIAIWGSQCVEACVQRALATGSWHGAVTRVRHQDSFETGAATTLFLSPGLSGQSSPDSHHASVDWPSPL